MRKFLLAFVAILCVATVAFAEVKPYVRATITPGDANMNECNVYDYGLLKTESAFGIGGGADILNVSENAVFGTDLGLKVRHLGLGYKSSDQSEKDKNVNFDVEMTPYIKYKASAINFGAGPMIGVNYANTKYHTGRVDANTKDYKRLNVNAGGRIFAEIPFANQRFAFVPAVNYSRTIYTNETNRLTKTTDKGWYCDHYTNGSKAWASFSVKCNL